MLSLARYGVSLTLPAGGRQKNGISLTPHPLRTWVGSSMKDGFVFLSSYKYDVIYIEEQEENNANVSVSLSTVQT